MNVLYVWKCVHYNRHWYTTEIPVLILVSWLSKPQKQPKELKLKTIILFQVILKQITLERHKVCQSVQPFSLDFTQLRDLSNLKIIKARQQPHHDIIQTNSLSKIIVDEIYWNNMLNLCIKLILIMGRVCSFFNHSCILLFSTLSLGGFPHTLLISLNKIYIIQKECLRSISFF